MKCSVGLRLLWLSVLLICFVVLGCYAFVKEQYAGLFFFALASGYIVYRIIYWQQSTTRMFIRMLDELKYHDNTMHFSTADKRGLEKSLVERMNALLNEIKKNSLTKAEQSTYYDTLLNIIDSCLIVVNEENQIIWMNLQAELQLCGYAVHSIDELQEVHEKLPHLIRTMHPGEMKSLRI